MDSDYTNVWLSELVTKKRTILADSVGPTALVKEMGINPNQSVSMPLRINGLHLHTILPEVS